MPEPPDVSQVEILHELAQLRAANQPGVGACEARVARRVPAIEVRQDVVEVTSQDERPAIRGEVRREDMGVEGRSVLRLGWTVDADNAELNIIEKKIDAKNASASDARVAELNRGAEVHPGTEDEDDALGVAGARHVE